MTPKKKKKRNRLYLENPPGPDSGFEIEMPERGGRRVRIYYESKVTLYRWINEGKVQAVVRHDVTRIPHREFKRLMRER